MTTYILGAGASSHVGYPLTATMASDLLTWMKQRNEPERMDYARVAHSVEENFSLTANLEKLLLEMEELGRTCATDTPEGIGIQSQLGSDRFMLACALQERFAEIRRNSSDAYQQLCREKVRGGDCIITFNYDTSLERELRRANKWQIGDGYGFSIPGLPHGSAVKVLKLHGSCNWLASFYTNMVGYGQTAPGCVFGPRPVVSETDMCFLGYTTERDKSFRDGQSGLYPLLILPTPSKKFFVDITGQREFSEFFNELWKQAADVLTSGGDIVICGYSVPDIDQRASALLLHESNRSSRITILSRNSSEAIAKRFRDSGHDRVTALSETRFEEWVC